MRHTEKDQQVLAELPDILTSWFTEHEERLQSCGITGDIQQSPADGRTKTSAWMMLERDDHIGALIVWSSGEAELEYGDVVSGQLQQRHLDLHTFPDLLDVIESLLEWFRTKGGQSPGA
ncbi:hypothetical protein [Streptomyces sp. NPDC049555]|uniref:hypothetical protein n=1 Tax=Streptomyces sp. NPDC049555 TaxID=3154930 RepID=UPI00342259C4